MGSMAESGESYAPRMTITIGSTKQVELPPRVFRGRLTGFLFDTDKCFVLPGSLSGIKEIKRFYDEHPGLEVLVTGHADKTGDDAHNLTLSEERAASLASFLEDKVDDWMPWYGSGKPAGKRWGIKEDQHMLAALGHYQGPIHGKDDAATRAAVAAIGGAKDRPIDEATRRKLVEQYMKIDDTTLPAGTKIVTHGCGESHPLAGDDAANRRVEVFFFEGPIEPAPPAKCPSGGCSQYAKWKEALIEDFDLSVRRELSVVTVSLRDLAAQIIEGAPYRMSAGDQRKHGRAAKGQATLAAPLDAERCLVEWGRKDDPDLGESGGTPAFRLELYLHYDLGSDEEQAKMRLHNLGFPDSAPLADNLKKFQARHRLEATGSLDAATQQKLVDVHGTLATPVSLLEREEADAS
jgi:outer membrane protein OmpA-like peptidoglycan-associated protein